MSNYQMSEEQLAAVRHKDGPAMVLSGPGSGKTTVVTHRIAHLLNTGESPDSIAAITFTKKAALEMADRVKQIIEPGTAKKVWISTFHAFGSRVLRAHPEAAKMVSGKFSIADQAASLSYIKESIAKAVGCDITSVVKRGGYKSLDVVAQTISTFKQNCHLPYQVVSEHYPDKRNLGFYRQVYSEYQQLLKRSQSLDFNDLIMRVVLAWEESDWLRDKYADRFAWVMVDEYQDTSHMQYRFLKLLTNTYKSPFVVGDPDQCVLPGTLILTDDGMIPVEQIEEYTQAVRCAAGHGEEGASLVDKVFSRDYEGEIIVIRTAGGRTLRVTPEHCMFARFGIDSDLHYVYLMYSKELGYRVGRTGSVRSDGEGRLYPAFMQRLRQERADAIWLVRACDTPGEASFWEAFISAQYGLPTACFYARDRALMTDDLIADLFSKLDTHKAAEVLANDMGIDLGSPHHQPQATVLGKVRKSVTFTMFSESRKKRGLAHGWHGHILSVCSSDEEFRLQVEPILKTLPHKNGPYWQARRTLMDYDLLNNQLKCFESEVPGIQVRRRAKLTDKTFSFMPAGNLVPGAIVPVLDEEFGGVGEDEVVSVERELYRGKVYDLSIPNFRNYSAGGIVVHNSIYKFRGADISNILHFERDYPGAVTYRLEANFRCTQTIAEAANRLIRNNKSRKEKEIKPTREKGKPLRCIFTPDQRAEARFFASECMSLWRSGDCNLRDIVVLYRTNILSRALEEALVQANVPYRLLKGLGFYQRAVILDMLAYLKLVINPDDDAALLRIYNIPTRGIGQQTMKTIVATRDRMEMDRGEPVSLIKAFRESERDGRLSDKARKGIHDLTILFDSAELLIEEAGGDGHESVERVITSVLSSSGYEPHLQNIIQTSRSRKAINDARNRLDHLRDLEFAARDFDETRGGGLLKYLEWISLLQSEEDDDRAANRVTLSTIHSAKGLEWKHVYLIGMCENLMPIVWEFDFDGALRPPEEIEADLEEERRLLFVAMTRAKDRVVFLYPDMRRHQGSLINTERSRFLFEIEAGGEDMFLQRYGFGIGEAYAAK